MCQNIKRSRAALNNDIIHEYFDNLSQTLEGIPLSNIINYDETNLSDDPRRKKVICKRGTKYPERVMNQSKSATISYVCCISGWQTTSSVYYL